jgi:hypothetical protein
VQEVPDKVPLVLVAEPGKYLHADRRLPADSVRAGGGPVDHHERAVSPDQHLAEPAAEAARRRVQPPQDVLGPLASRGWPAPVIDQRPVLRPPPLRWIAIPAQAAEDRIGVKSLKPPNDLGEPGREPALY